MRTELLQTDRTSIPRFPMEPSCGDGAVVQDGRDLAGAGVRIAEKVTAPAGFSDHDANPGLYGFYLG